LTAAILDTTVILHLFRKYEPALSWFDIDETFAITSITWMEAMIGVANKRVQAETLDLLNGFEMLYLSQADQQWAQQQIERLRFSHSVGMNDCMIASVAHRLQMPLYTHNLKDMTPMIGELAVKPYE
jgi:predicted nucleic acid-binding protein